VPKINVDVPHGLTAEDAKKRLEKKAEFLQGRYGDQVKDMTQTWAGNLLTFGFKTMGMRLDGTVSVEENRVVVNGDLPFAAMMFKGKIESEIREQLEHILRT
jgi:putative polyhydroxyalkanoate system protein